MKDQEEILADNYVKGLLREDHPEKNEEEIEKMFKAFINRPKVPPANQDAE